MGMRPADRNATPGVSSTTGRRRLWVPNVTLWPLQAQRRAGGGADWDTRLPNMYGGQRWWTAGETGGRCVACHAVVRQEVMRQKGVFCRPGRGVAEADTQIPHGRHQVKVETQGRQVRASSMPLLRQPEPTAFSTSLGLRRGAEALLVEVGCSRFSHNKHRCE